VCAILGKTAPPPLTGSEAGGFEFSKAERRAAFLI
jgi:hypothetical protein